MWSATNAMRETRAPGVDPHVFRELRDPVEIVALIRLRHRIYFEENGYGPPKPLGLDLTAHDARTRLFGVFRGDCLVGGVRVVYRTEQAASLVFRAVRAAVNETAPLASSPLLPSEEAFDLRELSGLSPSDVQAELGRFAMDRTAGIPWLVSRTITGAIAVLLAERCPHYLYSCAATLAKRYARFTNPLFTFERAIADGIGSDGFVFPVPTIAAVARPADAPLGDTLRRYVEQLKETGAILLTRS
jgi:hypothetical protein